LNYPEQTHGKRGRQRLDYGVKSKIPMFATSHVNLSEIWRVEPGIIKEDVGYESKEMLCMNNGLHDLLKFVEIIDKELYSNTRITQNCTSRFLHNPLSELRDS
jgi:hypothetical protein